MTATRIPEPFLSKNIYKKIKILRPSLKDIQIRLEIVNLFEKLDLDK